MRKSIVIIIICVVGLIAILLTKAPSEDSVAGEYRRTFLGVNERITLERTGKLHQVLVYPDGKQWAADGHWEIDGHSVMLIDCLYYFDDDKWSLLTPPKPVMGIRFAVRGNSLTRELGTAFEKMPLSKNP